MRPSVKNKNVKDKTYYVRFNPTTEQWIEAKIATGEFKTASEAIQHFLTILMIQGR